AGVGFPRPLAIEPILKVEGVLAVGVELGALPKTSLGGVDTSLWALSADPRAGFLWTFDSGFTIASTPESASRSTRT
ncbi:MAG TPA: hypothetical protein VIF62_16880, partial [Labilithrix sp.]